MRIGEGQIGRAFAFGSKHFPSLFSIPAGQLLAPCICAERASPRVQRGRKLRKPLAGAWPIMHLVDACDHICLPTINQSPEILVCLRVAR